MERKKTTNLTAIDLFCGCGGMAKGLELAGINVVVGLDYFKEAGDTYKRNFDHKFIYGDITQKETKELLYKTIKQELNGRHLNIVAGGFPCQGFSLAGKRNIDDPRNKLYLEVIDVVKNLLPDYVFLENVRGLESMNNGEVLKTILNDFKNLGYEINAYVLKAVDFEVPQKRERLIFIGNRINKKNLYPLPIVKNNEYKTMENAIGNLIDKKESVEFSHVSSVHSINVIKNIANTPEGKCINREHVSFGYKNFWNQPTRTITTEFGGRYIHPILPRYLTARECARLQGFSDDFLFCGSKTSQFVQIGNAVPPNLSKAVGLAIINGYEYE